MAICNVDPFTRALLASDAQLGADVGSNNRVTTDDTKLLPGFWRGMNLTEQANFHAALLARLDMRASEPSGVAQTPLRAESSLIPLVFETHDGKKLSINAEEGKSIMEVAK